MAITPLVVVDDDGTLTTGTVWNAALQATLEANINAADCFDKSTTEQTVASTTTPTSIYSFSVPGGTLSTNRILRLTITGVYVNTHGSNSALTVIATYGATTLVSGSIGSFATNTVGPFRLIITLNGNNATNSQRSEVQIDLPTSATNAATLRPIRTKDAGVLGVSRKRRARFIKIGGDCMDSILRHRWSCNAYAGPWFSSCIPHL